MSKRVEVRPSIRRGVWNAWDEQGNIICSGTLANALANALQRARAGGLELWLTERRKESEHGAMIGDFSQ
jgi:hypothetical protein